MESLAELAKPAIPRASTVANGRVDRGRPLNIEVFNTRFPPNALRKTPALSMSSAPPSISEVSDDSLLLDGYVRPDDAETGGLSVPAGGESWSEIPEEGSLKRPLVPVDDELLARLADALSNKGRGPPGPPGDP